MRQLKFRIWDFDLQRMYGPGDELTNAILMRYDSIGNFQSMNIGQSNYDWEIIGGLWHDEIELKMSDPMQFTGMLDKNGKEIYEGDIVRITYFSDGANENFRVVWQEEKFRFTLLDRKNEDWSFTARNTFEVIGNIYANPDLITSNPPQS